MPSRAYYVCKILNFQSERDSPCFPYQNWILSCLKCEFCSLSTAFLLTHEWDQLPFVCDFFPKIFGKWFHHVSLQNWEVCLLVQHSYFGIHIHPNKLSKCFTMHVVNVDAWRSLCFIPTVIHTMMDMNRKIVNLQFGFEIKFAGIQYLQYILSVLRNIFNCS